MSDGILVLYILAILTVDQILADDMVYIQSERRHTIMCRQSIESNGHVRRTAGFTIRNSSGLGGVSHQLTYQSMFVQRMV